MITVVQYLVIAAVIGAVMFGIAVFVFGRGEQMAPLPARVSPVELPASDLRGDHVRGVRFGLALRGYRMSDVDWALERLADEIDVLHGKLDAIARGSALRSDAALAETPAGTSQAGLVHRDIETKSDAAFVGIPATSDSPATGPSVFGSAAQGSPEDGSTAGRSAAPSTPATDSPATGSATTDSTAVGSTAVGDAASGSTAVGDAASGSTAVGDAASGDADQASTR